MQQMAQLGQAEELRRPRFLSELVVRVRGPRACPNSLLA